MGVSIRATRTFFETDAVGRGVGAGDEAAAPARKARDAHKPVRIVIDEKILS
jgi:hypothetical protein